jgi:SAM-dependent methyltransferase
MTDYTGVDNLEVMRLARNYNRHLCRLVALHDPADGPVIDFGAGLGAFSGCALGDRSRVLCIEPDHTLSAHLREEGYSVSEDTLPVQDGSVAFIFSLNVQEHISDDAAAVQDLARKLQPGGRLMLYLPAFPVLYSSMDRKVGHYRRYTRAALTTLLAEAGFRVLIAHYEDALGFFATLVFKFVDRRGGGDINGPALVFYDRWIFPVSRFISRFFGRWIGKNLLIVAEKPAL